jgi:acyl CoA:acetate/3-ketoacid CoA transferase alpha subunit
LGTVITAQTLEGLQGLTTIPTILALSARESKYFAETATIPGREEVLNRKVRKDFAKFSARKANRTGRLPA